VIDTELNAPHRLWTGWPCQTDPRRAKYTAQRAAPLRQLCFPKVERLFLTQCFYVNGRGLSRAHNRPRVYASSQLL
jgi:hypothetical protein